MTEKNDQKMDSTTEEEEENLLESEEQETQLDPKHRTPALANLIAGYALALGFGILLAIGMGEQTTDEIVDEGVVTEGETMAAANAAPDEGEIISLVGGANIPWPQGQVWDEPGYTADIEGEDYTSFVEVANFVDVNVPGLHQITYTVKDKDTGEVRESLTRFVTVNPSGFVADPVVYNDRLTGTVLADDPITAVVGGRDSVYFDNDDRHLRLAGTDLGHGRVEGGVGGGGHGGGGRGVRVDDGLDAVSLEGRLRDLDEDLVVI